MRIGFILFVIVIFFPACGNASFSVLSAKLFLYNQSLEWKSIDPSLQAQLQEFYDFDLSKVRYSGALTEL
ncbi:MAG: hypothetical protein AB8G05_18045 [Oligoflexales bacterium]